MAKPGLPSGYHHNGRDELSTRPREPELRLRSKAGGEEARRVLLEGNLLRVVSTPKATAARGYPSRTRPRRVASRFDPGKGDRLCIHDTWWIEQSMARKLTSKEDG